MASQLSWDPSPPNYSPSAFNKSSHVSSQEVGNALDILRKLRVLKDERKFCDLDVKVSGKIFPVHKAVLAASSPVIAALAQDSANTSTKQEVSIDFENTEVFEEFLNFLYGGSVALSESSVECLLHLAVNFKIESLINQCKEFLKDNLYHGRYVQCYLLSLKFGFIDLEEFAVFFVENRLHFLEQGPVSVSQLLTFLSTGKMAELKREVKFFLILTWVSSNSKEREQYLSFLLNKLDWTAPINDFLENASVEKYFLSNEFCLYQILQILVRWGHPLGKFSDLFPRLSQTYSHLLDQLSEPGLVRTIDIQPCPPIPVRFKSSFNNPMSESVDKETVCQNVCDQQKKSIALNTAKALFSQTTNTFSDKEINPVEQNMGNLVSDSPAQKSDTCPCPESHPVEVGEAHLKENNETIPMEVSVRQEEGTKISKRKGQPRHLKPKSIKVNDTGQKRKRGRPRKNPEDKKHSYKKAQKVVVKIEACSDLEDANYTSPASGDDTDEYTPETYLKQTKRLKTKPLAKGRKYSKTKLDTHRSQPALKLIHCTIEGCSYVTRKKHLFDQHIEKIHKSSIRLSCRHCDFHTPIMRDLCRHLKQHYTGPPFNCDRPGCTFQAAIMKTLACHLMEHDGEKPYRCDLCDKSFLLLNRLSNHRKLHKGKQFQCDVCGKSFATKGSMVEHRRIHFDQKPFLCDTCGYSTKHQTQFCRHKKIHTGEYLRCQTADCDYVTTNRAHMNIHMNRHLNIRNYICKVCGKAFVLQSKLVRHELIHLEQKLFQCATCSYETSRKDRMKLHMNKHRLPFAQDSYIKMA